MCAHIQINLIQWRISHNHKTSETLHNTIRQSRNILQKICKFMFRPVQINSIQFLSGCSSGCLFQIHIYICNVLDLFPSLLGHVHFASLHNVYLVWVRSESECPHPSELHTKERAYISIHTITIKTYYRLFFNASRCDYIPLKMMVRRWEKTQGAPFNEQIECNSFYEWILFFYNVK